MWSYFRTGKGEMKDKLCDCFADCCCLPYYSIVPTLTLPFIHTETVGCSRKLVVRKIFVLLVPWTLGIGEAVLPNSKGILVSLFSLSTYSLNLCCVNYLHLFNLPERL